MAPFGSRLAPHRLVGVGRAIGKGSALQRGPSPALGGPPPRRRLAIRLAVVAASVALLGALLPVSGVLAVASPTDSTGRQALASATSSAGATAIAAGLESTCAILSGGSVDCWGSNGFGELGNGTTTDSYIPVAVRGISGATAIAVGAGYACALLAGGGVDCWGYNVDGELGNGTHIIDSPIPVAVSGITGATAIAAGDFHACALLAGGGVDCWGSNASGELGNGTTTSSSTPVAVSGLTGVSAISATNGDTCALLAGGSIDCWGYNNGTGQLGDGTVANSSTPVSVSGISGATAITVGLTSTCAILSGGSVACWGSGFYGELGNGTSGRLSYSLTPVVVSGLAGVAAIGAGASDACALLAGGSVDCWGDNEHGELGNGTTTDSSTPVAVSGLTSVTAIAVGSFHTCALLAGGGVDCWGGIGGVLGNGTTTGSSTPVAVVGLTGSQTAGLTNAWLAKVGPSGVNGTASIATVTPSAGSIGLKLVKLRASSTLPVVLYKGTCASVGPVLFRLPSITTTKTGTASRTSTLTAAQVKLILAATTGSGKVAIRVGTGTSAKCGAFAKRTVLGPQAVVQAFYDWYLATPGAFFQAEAGRPDLTPAFVRWLKHFYASSPPTGGYDPFLCAQNTPDSVRAGTAAISGLTATVAATQVWNGIVGPPGSGPKVSLVLAPAGWQISALGPCF